MRRLPPFAAALASCLVAAAAAPTASAQVAPATGLALLQAMHDAYGGRWYTTLTFTQQTTRHRADGSDTVSTWYETLRQSDAAGTQLRLDVGDPAEGNGVLYTADSLWAMRGGHLAVARGGGNALLPLIEGVYLQPVERTADELKPAGIDLQRPVLTGRWNARPVWIAGAASATDTTSPQIWVDVERKVVVRAMLVPAPTAPLLDVRLEGLVPLAGGWLATRCAFLVAGKVVQQEAYHDWAANVGLAPGLFDVATWTTAPHWAAKPRGR